MFDGVSSVVEPHFVGRYDVERWLPRVRPHLAKMAEGSNGNFLPEDIEACVREGKILLWLMLRGGDLMAVVATEIVNYPRARAMRFVGLVGHQPRSWAHIIVAVETSARQNFGCTKMEAMHIPKFRTLLPGYRVTHWKSEKELP